MKSVPNKRSSGESGRLSAKRLKMNVCVKRLTKPREHRKSESVSKKPREKLERLRSVRKSSVMSRGNAKEKSGKLKRQKRERSD